MTVRVVTTGLDVLVKRLERAPDRVWLASPFVGPDVGLLLAERFEVLLEAGLAPDVRFLTSLTEKSLRSGYTDPVALRQLVKVLPPKSIRTLTNIHAKVALIDNWALIGSGNLSASGLDGLNAEMGITTGEQAIVSAVARTLDVWWQQAAVVNPSHLAGWRVVHDPRPHRARGLRRLPTTAITIESGSVLAAWHRDQAHDALASVLASGKAPAPDPRLTLPGRRRSPAYRMCQRLTTSDRRTRQLLRNVLVSYPVTDARVHAAYRLTAQVPARGIEASTLRLLIDRYENDPALAVRRNAARAISRLRAGGQIAVHGPIRIPQTLDGRHELPRIARLNR